jgi:hypothetical protein
MSRPRSSLLTECPWKTTFSASLCLCARTPRCISLSLCPSATGRKRFSRDKKRTGARAQTHNEKTRFSFASESVWWSLIPFSTSNPRAQEKKYLIAKKMGRGLGGGVLSFTTENLPPFIEQNIVQHNIETTTREISAWKNQRKIKTLCSDKDRD